MLRRVLLGAVTALVVARPLVRGEDPGLLLRPWSDASGLVLTLLWLLTGLGTAVWHLWSGQRAWRAGAVEGGLLAVVGLVFASATWSAAYSHPAWLIAWEWLALFVAFCVVRQLVRTSGEGQRLLAALLASAVGLSAYAIYQYTVEFPQQWTSLRSTEALRDALEQQQIQFGADDSFLQSYRKRIEFDHVFATFVHPNSFAGYLGLLLPAGVGWTLAAWRRDRRSWLLLPAALGAVLLAAALWLTHSRGAIAGLLLAAIALGVVSGRRWLWARKAWVLPGVVMMAVAIVFVTLRFSGSEGMEKSQRSFGLRLDYWTATWHMIVDSQHPRFFWLGVGPGNFSRYYPRYMLPTAWEEIKEPHNFALEMWATSGVFAMLALLVALGAFGRAVWPALRDSDVAQPEPDEPPRTKTTPAWEFYLGGMAGLILGFVLWALDQTGDNAADQILIGGLIAAVRSLIWFGTFAVLERMPWRGPLRPLALAVGVTALLINFTVSDGISFPSVAVPLWVVVALTLDALPGRPAARPLRTWLGVVLPIPLLILASLAYGSSVFMPVTEANNALQKARRHYGAYYQELAQMEQQKPDAAKQHIIMAKAGRYVQQHILPPLEEAAKANPEDAIPHVELAQWLGQLWWLSERRPDTRDRALDHARRAIQLDPDGPAGYATRCQLYLLFDRQRDARGSEYQRLAVKDVHQLVKRSPTHPVLRYQLANLLFLVDDKVEGREQAREALRLDERSQGPMRKLNNEQRKDIRHWLREPAAGDSLPIPG